MIATYELSAMLSYGDFRPAASPPSAYEYSTMLQHGVTGTAT
ncbi:MAG: hypothetical protein ACQEQ0_05540 [Bacteroidota bacterium]